MQNQHLLKHLFCSLIVMWCSISLKLVQSSCGAVKINAHLQAYFITLPFHLLAIYCSTVLSSMAKQLKQLIFHIAMLCSTYYQVFWNTIPWKACCWMESPLSKYVNRVESRISYSWAISLVLPLLWSTSVKTSDFHATVLTTFYSSFHSHFLHCEE